MSVALSVIIPVHNAARTIEAALESVRNQTCQDIEIVIADDGSTDNSLSVINAFKAKASNVPPIKVLQLDKQGVSAARNAATAEATGKWLGFLDADDLWHADKVRAHLDIGERKGLLLSFSGYRFVGEAGEDLFEGFTPSPGPLSLAKLMTRNVIHTSAVVANASVVRELGGFDTRLSTNEDFDLWLRIAARGDNSIQSVPRRLADYRRHAYQVTKDWETMHAGWKVIAGRLEQRHPEIWAQIHRRAWGNQLEYSASLAYNAGDIPRMRALVRQAWSRAGLQMLREPNALVMTGIAVVSFLPKALQKSVGRVVYLVRKAHGRSNT